VYQCARQQLNEKWFLEHIFYYYYYYYKPFYAFDRFKLRDVYFSLWGNLRFQATDLHKFGLVGKVLARRWFLAQKWDCHLRQIKKVQKSYNIYHTIYNLVRNASSRFKRLIIRFNRFLLKNGLYWNRYVVRPSVRLSVCALFLSRYST
jgi:hypothetical protein